MRSSVPDLLSKIVLYKPRIFVFVGKVIWTHVLPSLSKLADQEDTSKTTTKAKTNTKVSSEFGLQKIKIAHSASDHNDVKETLLYVVPSTSGLCRVSVSKPLAHLHKRKHVYSSPPLEQSIRMLALFQGIKTILGQAKDDDIDTSGFLCVSWPNGN